MKNFIYFLFFVLLVACNGAEKREALHQDLDSAFNSYKQNFILNLWQLHPGWASGMGYHVYDSVLSIPNAERQKKERAFYQAQLDSLSGFNVNNLSNFNKTDLLMIKDYLHAAIWSIDTLKEGEWNPSAYNVCGGFAEMLNNNYDSLDKRLKNFAIKVKNVPAYYEAAKTNIKQPTIEHTELAVLQNEGGVSVFESDIKAALVKSNLSDLEKNELLKNCAAAAEAVKAYAKWLKTLDNKEPRSFRLGENLYKRKFYHDLQSGYSANEIYEKALLRKKELHVKMYAIAKQLWLNYFPNKQMPSDSLLAIRQMIDQLSLNHVKPEAFQLSIEKQIPELVKFIQAKNLIYLDSSKPLVVRKEPAYMAGMAGASISSPGPYDLNGNTYYNVGSMNGWSAERAESYLREYNHYILQILNIHEAIPGHYTQLIYSNQSAAGNASDAKLYPYPGIIKSVFGNGAMVEGWAVYSELMMLENGYAAPEGSTTADPEMWLMYYKWNLRSTCNTILDHAIHVKNLSKEDGIKLLTKEAFQQQAEAEGKWRRATLSQVQLCSYFTGFSEILALREEIKNKMGKQFDLKQFHEKFLSYGSAPVKYIRELMLADLN